MSEQQDSSQTSHRSCGVYWQIDRNLFLETKAAGDEFPKTDPPLVLHSHDISHLRPFSILNFWGHMAASSICQYNLMTSSNF